MKPNFTAKNHDELRLFLRPWIEIPGRNEGRTKDHREGFTIRRYLLALAEVGLLDFPVSLTAGETPDFILHQPKSQPAGIEITELTDPLDQREMTIAQRRELPYYEIGAFGGRGSSDLSGDGPQRLWCEYAQAAIDRKKVPIYLKNKPRLLLQSASNADQWISPEEAKNILKALATDSLEHFSEISAILGHSLVFDAGRLCRLLPIPKG